MFCSRSTPIASAFALVFLLSVHPVYAQTATAPEPIATSSLFPVTLTPADTRLPQPPPTDPQEPKSPANPRRPVWRLFTDIASDFAHLPSKGNAYWLIGGGATALLVHPNDGKINRTLIARGWVHDAFQPGKIIGYGQTQFAVAATTYTVGRVSNSPKVTHLGVDLLRAQIVAQTVTFAIKRTVNRERPDKSNTYSFPSGHAAVTFASATVLERHLGWRYALPTYLISSYVAASRLHENRHYMSDVIFGATLGIVVGRTITRHGRSHWGIEPAVGPDGVAIMIVRQ
jgi:membrane-associated phospholipid phosphatase